MRSEDKLPAFAGFFAIALTGQAASRAHGFGAEHAFPAGIAGALEAHVTPASRNGSRGEKKKNARFRLFPNRKINLGIRESISHSRV